MLNKDYFQHDMAYGDLPKRPASHKLIRDQAFNIAKHPKYEQLSGELRKLIIRKFENEKYIHHLKTIFGC